MATLPRLLDLVTGLATCLLLGLGAAASVRAEREGGEDVDSALIIPGDLDLLPFHDWGYTCNNADDYDEACPSGGSTAPDVVYRLTPSADVQIGIDLCSSGYDTKVFVYAEAPGDLVACNDDAGCGYSGWQSRLYGLALAAGVTYYLVVDGHGSSCGTYEIFVFRWEGCELPCAPGAQVEGEPPCEDGYVDSYNGGCGAATPVFSSIQAGPDGCATVCGKTCTYSLDGVARRDSDWYVATAAGGPVNVSVTAQCAIVTRLDPWADCALFPEGPSVETLPCVAGAVSHSYAPGATLWIVVNPPVWEGVPVSDYVLTACGLEPGPTPARETTWGRLKDGYRGVCR